MLTYLAVINWMSPWDDTTQNHMMWQQTNGLWCMLPWDMDALMSDTGSSIFAGEVGDRSNNFRGPNYIKDSFIKAFRAELKERNFLLINTLLTPNNITALGYERYQAFATSRSNSVNAQCGLGVFKRPNQPVNLAPANGQLVTSPASLVVSAYQHGASPTPAHAHTVWEMFPDNNSNTLPLFKLTTTTNLVWLPIPFGSLTIGQTYYWRCTFYDINGHPSLPSDKTAFSFAGIGPTDPVKLLTPIVTLNNPAQLQVAGHAGANYDVLTSTNLADWTWLMNLPGPNGAGLDPVATNFSLRFYKIQLP
jgi:hypothetical protein